MQVVITYGTRQTPFRAVLVMPLDFSAVKSSISAGKPESATLDSASGIIQVDLWSFSFKRKLGRRKKWRGIRIKRKTLWLQISLIELVGQWR